MKDGSVQENKSFEIMINRMSLEMFFYFIIQLGSVIGALVWLLNRKNPKSSFIQGKEIPGTVLADDMSQSSFFRVFRSLRYLFSIIFLIPYTYNLIYMIKQSNHLSFLEQTTARRFNFKERSYRASWGIMYF